MTPPPTAAEVREIERRLWQCPDISDVRALLLRYAGTLERTCETCFHDGGVARIPGWQSSEAKRECHFLEKHVEYGGYMEEPIHTFVPLTVNGQPFSCSAWEKRPDGPKEPTP